MAFWLGLNITGDTLQYVPCCAFELGVTGGAIPLGEVCPGEGLELGLGVGEGGDGVVVLVVVAEEFDDEDHAAFFADCPEGAEDVAATFFEEDGGKADKFVDEFALVGDAGFAGGEADEGDVEVGEVVEVFEGEGVVVGEVEGGGFGVFGVVFAVAGEVEEGGGGLEGLGECVGGDGGFGEGLGGGVELVEEGGFDADELEGVAGGGMADEGGGLGGGDWGLGLGWRVRLGR